MSACLVVHKVNPYERLHTPGNARYHDTLALDGDIDEVYQEEELSASFIMEPNPGLDDLVGEVKTETNEEKSLMVLFKE
jgi:hypothetical protein